MGEETTTVRARLLGAGTTFQRTRGNIGEIIGVSGKPFPATVEPQETVFALQLDKETIVGSGWRGDSEGAGAKRTGRQYHGGIHGQTTRDLRLLTLFDENGFEPAAHRLMTGFIRPCRDLSNGGTAG